MDQKSLVIIVSTSASLLLILIIVKINQYHQRKFLEANLPTARDKLVKGILAQEKRQKVKENAATDFINLPDMVNETFSVQKKTLHTYSSLEGSINKQVGQMEDTSAVMRKFDQILAGVPVTDSSPPSSSQNEGSSSAHNQMSPETQEINRDIIRSLHSLNSQRDKPIEPKEIETQTRPRSQDKGQIRLRQHLNHSVEEQERRISVEERD